MKLKFIAVLIVLFYILMLGNLVHAQDFDVSDKYLVQLAQMPVFPISNVRPLDPNGIDVPLEIVLMKRTYYKVHGDRDQRQAGAWGEHQEAGYAFVKPDGLSGQTLHTPVQVMSGNRDFIRYPKGVTSAIFHIHPKGTVQQPSVVDMQVSVTIHLSNYVYSEDVNGVPSLYVTRPDKKAFDKYDIANWNL